MTESLNGLRFDIYERVHLPDEAAPIEELEEIELVPHMQVIPLEDQVILRGHLLLTGVYRSQDERAGPRPLEHWIPVEISLPPNRVERLEELAVEIDNFDVDLLSARALNVTGVLGLKGLQAAAPQAPVWNEDGFTVVHQAPANAYDSSYEPEERYGELELPPFPQPSQVSPRAVPPQQQAPSGWDALASPRHSAVPPSSSYAEEERYDIPGPSDYGQPDYSSYDLQYGQQQPASAYRPPEPEPSAAYPPPSAVAQFPPPTPDGANAGGFGAAESAEEPQSQADVRHPDGESGWGDVTSQRLEPEEPGQRRFEARSEEKPDLKVALNSRNPSFAKGGDPSDASGAASGSPSPSAGYAVAASQPIGGVGLLSQLGDKGARRADEIRTAEAALQAEQAGQQAAPDSAASISTGDEIEWTRLFLSKEAASQSFRKVKLCIVQREDTLEAIATRYNVQSRELQLYNRLSDPHVAEGQILYIP